MLVDETMPGYNVFAEINALEARARKGIADAEAAGTTNNSNGEDDDAGRGDDGDDEGGDVEEELV
jgi:hypothetical protein